MFVTLLLKCFIDIGDAINIWLQNDAALLLEK